MSQIPASQGAVKLSEVSTDNAELLLGTFATEDAMTVIEQVKKTLADSFRRISLLLTSNNTIAGNPGTISWSGTQIAFGISTDIIVKLLQNESGAVVDLKLAFGASNTTNTFNSIALANGEILYIEIARSNIVSGPVVLENDAGGGSIVIGKTVKKASAGPLLANPQSDSSVSGTLSVPLALNVNGHLWWIPHGIYWPPNTSSPLGAVVTSTSLPIGSIIPFYAFGAVSPQGYSTTKIVAPGFQLCDGSVVIDPQSPMRNATRNDDGTPMAGCNFSADKFTPMLNGEHVAWSIGNSYNEGDYVMESSVRYVAIQAVPPGILISNTSYWRPEATYNTALDTNVHAKYRKTTVNRTGGTNNNTYLRGNFQSLVSTDVSAYGGENTHVLTTSEMPAHDHTGITGDDTPDHQHWTPTYNGVSGGSWEVGTGGWTGYDYTPYVPTSGAVQRHHHGIASQGSNVAHNNEPRYFNVVYLIRIY